MSWRICCCNRPPFSCTGFTNNANDFIEKLSSLASKIKEAVDTVLDLGKGLNLMLQNDEFAKAKGQLESCIKFYRSMCKFACKFLDKVEGYLKQCMPDTREQKAIKDAARNCQYGRLKDYMLRVSQKISKCTSAYNQFKKAYKKEMNKAKSAFNKGLDLCKSKEKESERRVEDIQTIGYGTASILIVTGLAVATGGTAAVFLALGGTVATVASRLVNSYEREAENFRKIRIDFDDVSKKSLRIGEVLDEIHEALKNMRRDDNGGSHASYEAFCQQFDTFTNGINETALKVQETMATEAK